MAVNSSAEIHAGKGNANGVISKAPLGTALPTDSTTPLAAAFVNLAYVSEDGVTQTYTIDSEEVREMNGRIVKTLDTDVTDTAQFSLLQSGNVDVLKAFYGDSAVDDSGDEIVVSHNGQGRETAVWVLDLAEGDHKRRIVYGEAKVSANEDVTYQRGEVIQYGVTITAYPNSAQGGSSAQEFITKVGGSDEGDDEGEEG